MFSYHQLQWEVLQIKVDHSLRLHTMSEPRIWHHKLLYYKLSSYLLYYHTWLLQCLAHFFLLFPRSINKTSSKSEIHSFTQIYTELLNLPGSATSEESNKRNNHNQINVYKCRDTASLRKKFPHTTLKWSNLLKKGEKTANLRLPYKKKNNRISHSHHQNRNASSVRARMSSHMITTVPLNT